MPAYLFHVCDGEGFCEDAEGLELPDDDAARREAARSARSIMADEIQRGLLNLASFIEVERDGSHIFTVTFEEAIEVKRPRGNGG